MSKSTLLILELVLTIIGAGLFGVWSYLNDLDWTWLLLIGVILLMWSNSNIFGDDNGRGTNS